MKFDYVIAGGGSAGCALAARLAENSKISICLIEAGGKGQDLFIKMPAGNGFVFGNPKLDWGYSTVPQKSLDNRSIYLARGKALGGSSIVNGMMYMRGVSADYDHWRQSGLPGWSYAELLPYFKRAEGAKHREGPYHGTSGPLKIEQSVNFGVLDKAFIKAAIASGHTQLNDFNADGRTGVGRSDSTVSRGVRQSSAIAYLKKRYRNLKVLTQRHISKIVFEQKRAIGIETTNGDFIIAKREVIVCQGAFGTPHLLMLSGLGPAEHLVSHGINPIVNLPGVGENLADHVDIPIQYASDRMDLSHAQFQRLDKAAGLMGRWLVNGSGPGGGALFSSMLFHAFDDPKQPELQVFMTPMIFDENFKDGQKEISPLLQRIGRRLLVRGRAIARPGIKIDINLERPKSLGTVRLANSDPLVSPLIDPNYLSDQQDIDHMVKGVRVMSEIMSRPEIAQYHQGSLGPWKNVTSDAEIISAIRATAYTGHHPACSVRMGTNNDNMAVLDNQLRVKGVEGLRVCDASAMPSQITGNLYATVIAIAEKAADMILGKKPLPAEYPEEKINA
jgi:choline dehydrogenase